MPDFDTSVPHIAREAASPAGLWGGVARKP